MSGPFTHGPHPFVPHLKEESFLIRPAITLHGRRCCNNMDIWVADELGQIKTCSVEARAGDTGHAVSDTEVVAGTEQHDRGDYVQIMAHAKWQQADVIKVHPAAPPTLAGNSFVVRCSRRSSRRLVADIGSRQRKVALGAARRKSRTR